MNPPFSADVRHILHAFDTAPDGCSIIALMNSDTYDLQNRYTRINKAYQVIFIYKNTKK